MACNYLEEEDKFKGYCSVCHRGLLEKENRCDKHKHVTDEENEQIQELFYVVAAINNQHTNLRESAFKLHEYLEKWYNK